MTHLLWIFYCIPTKANCFRCKWVTSELKNSSHWN